MKRIAIIITCLMCLITFSAYAKEHKALVTATINPGSFPTKGFYYTLGYNGGDSTRNYDDQGNPIKSGFGFSHWSITNFFIWAPGWQFLGADYGMKASLAVVDNTLENRPQVSTPGGPRTINIDKHGSGLADPMFTPLVLCWRFTRFDLLLETAVYIPVGYYTDATSGLPIGQDHWTISPKIGGTYYFDGAKSWALSADLVYDINFKNQDKDIEQGPQLYTEFSLAKSFTPLVTLAAMGYASWKLENDTGDDATAGQDRIYGLGPEMRVIVPQIKTTIGMKYIKEFGARARNEMDFFRMTAGWRF